MPKESFARQVRDTPSTIRAPSSEQPIPKGLRKLTDIELQDTGPLFDDEVVETPARPARQEPKRVSPEGKTRTEFGRALAMQQAEDLAKEFPGLIVNEYERRSRGTLALHRATGLEEELYQLGKKQESLRGTGKRVGLKSEPMLIAGLEKDRREIQKELERATEEMNFYHAYPDAESEIQHRIAGLEEQQERAAKNPLTQSGIDRKIVKLHHLSVLLEKALSYEDPRETARRNILDANAARVRLHETGKRSLEQTPSLPTKREKTSPFDPTPTELERWRSEIQKRAAQEANVIKALFYKQQLLEKKAELEVLADQLAERGQIVELPWQPGPKQKKSIMKESLFSRFASGVRNVFRGGETTRLLEQFEKDVERYETYKDALRAVEHGK